MSQEILSEFNSRFTYREDIGWLDHWEILDTTGLVQGDCEDYALTLIYLFEGASMWRFWLSLINLKHVLWFARSESNNEGHILLWKRGHGWVDNTTKVFNDKPAQGFKRRYPFLFPMVLVKFAVRPFAKKQGDE